MRASLVDAQVLTSAIVLPARPRRYDRTDRPAGTDLCPKRQLPVRAGRAARPAVGNPPPRAESGVMPTRRDKAPREPSAQPARAAGPTRRASPPALLRLQASAGN